MNAVAGLLIVFAVIDWIATAVLVSASRRLHEPALTERAVASVILSLSASGIAVLSGAFLAGVVLFPALRLTLLVGALVLLSVPQIVWLAAYLRGRFR